MQYLNKWTRPSDWGGTEWENHYVFLSQSRDSDALSRSNFECAAEIACALEDYPAVNEEHFSEVETTEANEVWEGCYSAKDRVEYIRENPDQFDFHNWADLMGCVRGNYFPGYASELLY